MPGRLQAFLPEAEMLLQTWRSVKPQRQQQAQTVDPGRASGEIAKLDRVLRGDMQNLTATMEFREGTLREGMSRIGSVREPTKNAGIDENGHHSYNPSLLSAASETDTPQSRAAANNRRSHSSIGVGWVRGNNSR